MDILPQAHKRAWFDPWAGADLPDPAEVKRAKQARQARAYIDALPLRSWLMVNTSTRALAAAGAV